MAGEIEQLNLSVSELSGDNANIKCVLDIKQNEWTKADQKAKKSSKPAINTEKIPFTYNAFQILDVEESSSGNDHIFSKEANHPRGQNDLVREEPKKVAADMESLINKAKAHTTKVNNHKIDQYNKLFNDLCSKHKITFINNMKIITK
jgi:hypothetical protein